MTREIGSPLGPWVISDVDDTAIRELAEIMGDPNPIHVNPAAVERLGLGRQVVNQGPANLAYIINMLMACFPTARLQTFDVRFTANVFAGDRVEAGGRITTRDDSEESIRLGCDIWLKVNDGAPAVLGEAVLETPPDANLAQGDFGLHR